MYMPGFTADAALHGFRRGYQLTYESPGQTKRTEVIPQIGRCGPSPCFVWACDSYGFCGCVNICIE